MYVSDLVNYFTNHKIDVKEKCKTGFFKDDDYKEINDAFDKAFKLKEQDTLKY